MVVVINAKTDVQIKLVAAPFALANSEVEGNKP
jgi:hypothetical protein